MARSPDGQKIEKIRWRQVILSCRRERDPIFRAVFPPLWNRGNKSRSALNAFEWISISY